MGCDIHQKNYLWSKIEKKYIDSNEVDDLNSGYCFKELFYGRDYDLFAVLAGVRGNRFEFFNRGDGLPDCVTESFRKYYEDGGFHNCVFYTPKQLNDNINRLINKIEKMKDKYLKLKKRYPKHYYDHWCDDGTDENEDNVYSVDDDYLVDTLKEIQKNLKYYLEYKWDGLKEIIDIDKTVIIFYFDS